MRTRTKTKYLTGAAFISKKMSLKIAVLINCIANFLTKTKFVMYKYLLITFSILFMISCKKNNQTEIFPSVKIGSQVWSIKNLDVITYRNGDPIPQITDLSQWASATSGAWCYYNNDQSHNDTYGKLYNWYAVNDSRGLAPLGWHVPNDVEWTILIDYLGGVTIAGGKLKATSPLWQTPNANATDSSGFSGLPGGSRAVSGTFSSGIYSIGYNGYWWSSTDLYSSRTWGYNLSYDAAYTNKQLRSKPTGFSVRCVKD